MNVSHKWDVIRHDHETCRIDFQLRPSLGIKKKIGKLKNRKCVLPILYQFNICSIIRHIHDPMYSLVE